MWYRGEDRRGRNGDGNRDGGGDGDENEDGNGGKNGSGNGDENRDEGEGERECGNLRSRIQVGRKTLEGGRRQRVTSNHRPKTRRTSETVASCGGPQPRDGRRGTGSGRPEERQRSAKNLKIIIDVMQKTGETWAEGERDVDKKVLVQ